MGQPQHTNNVRRIDFAKAATTRTRLSETEARARNSGSVERDHLKVVPLPEPRRRRSRRSLHNAQLLAIIVMAAFLGALMAVILLDPAL